MIQEVQVTREMLGQIDFGGIVACSYGEPGAMGTPGDLRFSTADGALYRLNTLYGDVSLEMLQDVCPGGPFRFLDAPSAGWRHLYLGAGNHMMIHEVVYGKLTEGLGEPEDPGAVCGRWLAGLGQPLLSKQERYRWLVDKAKATYKAAGDAAELKWCDACDEINLWTYWQGQDCLDAEIMVVGQDWGNPDSAIGKPPVENILHGRPYLENAASPTDLNLVTLFDRALRIDLLQKDKRLFFTNLLLGYRTGNNAGGSFDAQLDRDLPFFKELVNIIRPKLVICLGQNTYIHALKAFGAAVRFPRSYNAALDAGENTCEIDGIRLYGMAHCGVLGCLNRIGNQKGVSAADGLRQQIEDWEKIRI